MSGFAKHAFADIYNLPKPYQDTADIDSRAQHFMIVFAALSIFFAFSLLGGALHAAGATWVGKPSWGPVYSPVAMVAWTIHMPHVWVVPIGRLLILKYGSLAVGMIAVACYLISRLRAYAATKLNPPPDTHGSARIAEAKEIIKAGFHKNKGGSLGYIRDERNKCVYVRAPLESHTLVVAPTGAGKTTAFVYQLLTTWRGSVFVYDIKGENYDCTAGFRGSAEGMNSQCLRLSLSDNAPGNAHYNPLDMIRIGTPMEYPDAQDCVEVITDPEGKGSEGNTMSEGHFQTFAQSLLIAGVLYVKYKYPPEKQNLAQVLALFSDPKADNTLEILKKMRDVEHDPQGRYGWVDDLGHPTRKNKYIVGPAVDIILMTEEARASMLATCKRYLKPYRNPIVAEATAYSDFEILDLVNPEKNISLYLVVAPSSKDSLKPVTRLIINMIMKKLTERQPKKLDPEHRLHIVLDEFDTLGKLPIFVDGIQFLRGYGMDCSIIIQGYNQLFGRYGQHEMITGACNNSVVFTPTDDETKEKISRRLDDFTIREKVPSGGPNQKATYRDQGRRLLRPDEVGRIPADRALVFVKGFRPMYLWKRYAHEDAELTYRTTRPAPVQLPDAIKAIYEDDALDVAADFAYDEAA